MNLGKLKEVDIREVWAHEQYDFSSWLAEEENIAELGNTLNFTPVDVETEKFVGNYRCDIFCKDETSGNSILIENQLEATNHDHLGKIITYASGLDATTIVWIVSSARPEHASAIEWLNKHTDEDLSFFLVEVHAYKIGESDPAPYFKIIEKPNDFAKTVRSIANKSNLNDSEKNRLEFWSQFNDAIEAKGKPFNQRKISTDHWYSVAMGSSQCHISIDLVNKEHKIRVGVWIPNNKDLFDELYEKKDEIEFDLNFKLSWDRLEDKKSSCICVCIPGLDFNNKSNYSFLMDKTIDLVVKVRDVFKKYL